jgi:hypothetical protein
VTINSKHMRVIGCAVSLLGCLILAPPLRAVEFGINTYVLGLTFPLSGYTPPPGLYFRDTFFLYRGSFGPSSDRKTYKFLADIAAVAWYPGWEVLGGSLGFAAVVPYVGVRNSLQKAKVRADGSIVIETSTGTGNAIGDTELSAILGWHAGEHHWNAIVTAFTPTARFDPNRIGNTGLNRPALDLRGAYTYFGLQSGFEASAALGVAINGMNNATNYRSGAELHFEWSASQFFQAGFYVGAVGYIFQQLTPDSGSGATNGAFFGRVFSIGPSAGYTYKVDGRELNVSARWYHEFGNLNRPRGDAIFTSFDFHF